MRSRLAQHFLLLSQSVVKTIVGEADRLQHPVRSATPFQNGQFECRLALYVLAFVISEFVDQLPFQRCIAGSISGMSSQVISKCDVVEKRDAIAQAHVEIMRGASTLESSPVGCAESVPVNVTKADKPFRRGKQMSVGFDNDIQIDSGFGRKTRHCRTANVFNSGGEIRDMGHQVVTELLKHLVSCKYIQNKTDGCRLLQLIEHRFFPVIDKAPVNRRFGESFYDVGRNIVFLNFLELELDRTRRFSFWIHCCQ